MKLIKYSITVITILTLVIFTNSCKSDTCDYDKDCPELNLNIGDPCHPGGDESINGTVSEFCQCSTDWDCPALQLNIGDPCSVNNDGNINGSIDDNCDCIPG
ncbi:MAG: hypothetical protein V3U80_10825 [Flavobacteriaceae bacterium]